MTTPANQPDALVAFLRARYDEEERSVEDDVLPTPQADRVLADLDSKRRILDAAEGAFSWVGWDPRDETAMANAFAFESVLSLLALPYADRPGYREEWRP